MTKSSLSRGALWTACSTLAIISFAATWWATAPPTEDGTREIGAAETTQSEVIRARLCGRYQSVDQSTQYSYQRIEYLLGEIRNERRVRLDYGTLVFRLAKPNSNHVRIVGEVGVGKSTMVKRLAARLCRETNVSVIRMNIDEFSFGEDARTMPAFARLARFLNLTSTELQSMTDGEVVFLIDGVDRLPIERHTASAKFINSILDSAASARLVLISRRTLEFYELLNPTRWVTYELPPLTTKEARAYVKTKAKSAEQFDRFSRWLEQTGLRETYVMPGVGPESYIYLSTYDDAKAIWTLFKSGLIDVDTTWSIADIYRFLLRQGVLGGVGPVSEAATVEKWLLDAAETGKDAIQPALALLNWTTEKCVSSANKQGIKDPAGVCERLFADSPHGIKFVPCVDSKTCKRLYHQPFDDLIQTLKLAEQIDKVERCEEFQTHIESQLHQRAAMLVGQRAIRRNCLPQILGSLCRRYLAPERVFQQIRRGFPQSHRARASELSESVNRPDLSKCGRRVLDKLVSESPGTTIP